MPDIEQSRRERRFRTVIVEDEAPARGRLIRFLKAHRDVEIAGEAETGAEAIALIERVVPDLVVLDIKLPDISGLEVLKRLADPPHVIFSTAYDIGGSCRQLNYEKGPGCRGLLTRMSRNMLAVYQIGTARIFAMAAGHA